MGNVLFSVCQTNKATIDLFGHGLVVFGISVLV
jgi:hypothetical protein